MSDKAKVNKAIKGLLADGFSAQDIRDALSEAGDTPDATPEEGAPMDDSAPPDNAHVTASEGSEGSEDPEGEKEYDMMDPGSAAEVAMCAFAKAKKKKALKDQEDM